MSNVTVEGTGYHFSLAEVTGIEPVWIATGLLLLVYGVLVTEKVNRAVLAMLGAALMVIFGIINQHQAIAGIDFNTLALLIGMMIIVAITSRSGLFQYVAIKSAKMVRANPLGIMIMLTVITAVFSAFLDNVTTVLLIAPVTLLITDALKVKVFPFFLMEILASNIGGTATLVGDPPNIIIGSAAGFSFNDFLVNLAPVSIICTILLVIGIYFFYRKSFNVSLKDRAKIMRFRARDAITDAMLMKKALVTLALVLFGLMVGHDHGIEPGTSALAGGALLLLLAYGRKPAEDQNEEVHSIFTEVEWVTIFFFAGLFIIVAGVEHTGLLEQLASHMLEFTEGDLMSTSFFILWTSALLSAVLDNIPFVATMIPMIESTATTFGGHDAIEPLWWSLALGACFGGNGSLIGASANLTVAAFAEKAKQPIRFLQFMLYAFPVMIISVIIANIYLYLRFF